MYDLIGDIHGHAAELMQLLQTLGYREQGGVYRHPERQVIFVGDFIDRGPRIREVLQIVRGMVENGQALSVMGNHELNALGYHTPDPDAPGEFLRRHIPKNVHQHRQTRDQLTRDELNSYLDWFRTLPLWLDLPGLRVVHACWDPGSVQVISEALTACGGITEEFLQSACREGHPLFAPVEIVLKGKEAPLPPGLSFADKDGHVRTRMRLRWYLPPAGHTYGSYSMTDSIDLKQPLEDSLLQQAVPYPAHAKPLFVGHYWLNAAQPALLTPNVACLDYSVAKGGYLCAYRWDGEQTLSNSRFVRVG